jgi:hypothetical protein
VKYIKPKARLESDKIRVPKDFEFKIFWKLIHDLAENVKRNYVNDQFKYDLMNDFKIVQEAVRKRDIIAVATLHNSLVTKIKLQRNSNDKKDSYLYFVVYQLESFLKKYPFSGTNTEIPALDSFKAGERSCWLYNKQNYKALESLDRTFLPLFGNCLEEIRQDIKRLLGETTVGCDGMTDVTHGPGVAYGDCYKKGETTTYFKFRNLPYTVTQDALPYAKTLILSWPQWIGALDNWYRTRCSNRFEPIDMQDFWSRIFKVVKGNRITTVPKSALTDRTIAIEPVLNVFLQLNVDRYIRKSLRDRWNIDINTQEKNQELARLGSIDGSYATIDLKNASDTISLKICEMLLPPLWYDLLLNLRSPTGELKDTRGSFEKLSSMGNGYTFAIETVIFAALSRHAMRRSRAIGEISVFGDDIIVPTEAAKFTIDLLEASGFQINSDKSFTSGPFRESCGTDWYLGTNVRPVFLKRSIKTVRDVFYIHNKLTLLEEQMPWFWEMTFPSTKAFLRKYIPKQYKFIVGPITESIDTHLFVNKPRSNCEQGFPAIVVQPRKFNKNTDFFFRKLMVPIRDKPKLPLNKWMKEGTMSTGNAFDVTKRDFTHLRCVKVNPDFTIRIGSVHTLLS